jgi:hypothetical protein
VNIFTAKQWLVLGIGGIVGFAAIYFGLGYGFWASLALEAVLMSAAIGVQAWKTAQAQRQ